MNDALHEWSLREMAEKAELVKECREIFGIEAARQLAEQLGFPITSPDVVDSAK